MISLKALAPVVFLPVIFSTAALADVKPAGTLLPHHCSTQIESTDRVITRACLAHKVRVPGDYITITDRGGYTHVFYVLRSTQLPRKGTMQLSRLSTRLESIFTPNGRVTVPFVPYLADFILGEDTRSLIDYVLSGSLPFGEFEATDFQALAHTMRF